MESLAAFSHLTSLFSLYNKLFMGKLSKQPIVWNGDSNMFGKDEGTLGRADYVWRFNMNVICGVATCGSCIHILMHRQQATVAQLFCACGLLEFMLLAWAGS